MSLASEGSFARAQRYAKSPEFTKLWRYLAVSGVSTFLSLAMLYLFYRVVGLTPTWANVVATCIATVPSYYLNRTWAWGKSGPSHLWREVVPFWVIAFFSLVLSTLAVRYAGHEASSLHSKDAKALVLLFANFVTYGFLWVAKFIFFNKVLFKHHEVGGPKDGSAVGLADAELR
jgi:putative flippase GtrA